MLQYDNSAFYFFALSTISFYLVPSWYSILSRIYEAFCIPDEKIGAVERTSEEKEKAKKLRTEMRGMNKLKQRGFLVNLALTVIFTVVFVWLLVSVSTDGEVNSFDPFAILEVDHGADNKSIKRAYRNLSLKYHPDKNPGDREAEAKFMMIAKAYEALTDETAKENYEKYGNPDGKQSLAVSIGLPSFLLETQNRNLVLVSYLIIMVGIIPFCVWNYYSNSSKFGEKDVMYDTYAWYHHTLSEHTISKQLPEILAGSAEFRRTNMPKSAAEKELIASCMAKVRSYMLKPKYNHPVCIKGNVLLHMHLLRQTEYLTGLKDQDKGKPSSSSSPANAVDLERNLRDMLRLSQPLVDAMISVCKHQDSIQTAINCIEFGQYITQAMWVKDSPLLQLPHFTAEEVKHAEKAGKNTRVTSVQQYRDLPDEQKKGMANFTDAQKEDVHRYLKIFPDWTVETKVFVDDDEDDRVYEGDLCTIRVVINRNNLDGADRAGLVHAPRFPFPKKEAFWIILGQIKEGKIINIEKVVNTRQRVEHDIKFLAPPKGKYEFDLLVKSNGYVGIDEKCRVEMETLDNASLPEYKIHPDDAQLDDEPTLFEEILNAHNIEQDSDDEDDDDDDEDSEDDEEEDDDDHKAGGAAAAQKRERLRKARQADDDDDDDSDEDAEEVYAQK